MKLSYFVFAILSIGLSSPAFANYDKETRKELAKEKKVLERKYEVLKDELEIEYKAKRKIEKYKKEFAKVQEKWEEYRDADCELRSVVFEGDEKKVKQLKCLIEKTSARIEEIKNSGYRPMDPTEEEEEY